MALRNQDSATYIAATMSLPNFDQDYTFCWWARFTNLTDVGCVWSMSDSAGGKHLNIGIRGGKVGAYAFGGGAMVETAYTAGDLLFVALRFQGTTAKIRLNNSADVTATYTRPTGAGVQGMFLFSNQFGDNLNGILRDFRRYSRYMADNEIESLYYSEGGDSMIEIARERYDFNSGVPGTTLAAFTDVKNLLDRAITIGGVGTSTNLDWQETQMRSSLRGANV